MQPINQSDAGSLELKWAGGGATARFSEVRGRALVMEQSDWQQWPVKQEGAAAAVGHPANWDMFGDWCKVVEVGVVQEEESSFPVLGGKLFKSSTLQ